MKKLIITLIFLLLSSICHADIWSGLVGWWKFDEASSGTCGGATPDSSGQNNSGACQASPTYSSGKIGAGAITLNGSSQYVLVANSASTDLTGKISLCCWFKLNASAATFVAFIDKEDWASSEGYYIGMKSGGSKSLYFGFNRGANEIDTGNNVYTNGTWNHICGVYNGSGEVIYLNGAQILTGGNATAPASTVNGVTLGYDFTNSGHYISGSLDDARIYNRALSAGDVAMLYQYGKVQMKNSTWKNFKLY